MYVNERCYVRRWSGYKLCLQASNTKRYFLAIRLAFQAVNKKQETKKEIIVLAAVFIFFMDVIFQG